MDKKYLVLGIIDETGESEEVRYLYLFPDRSRAEEFVQRVYRMRTAARWEIVSMPVETIVTNTVEQHLIDIQDVEEQTDA